MIMDNISNTELLYDVIDSLSDEEFKDFLDTISLGDKVEEVKDTVVEEKEVEEEVNVEDEKKKLLQERLAKARKHKEIQEKISKLRHSNEAKAVETKVAENVDETEDDTTKLRKQIIEKLEISRRKKMIQERIKAMKENK